jgi:hypothetical protein
MVVKSPVPKVESSAEGGEGTGASDADMKQWMDKTGRKWDTDSDSD